MDKIYVTYDEIHNEIKKISPQLIEFNPDIIIAIGGGGLIPGRIIRTFLKKPLYTVTIQYYNEKDELNSNAKIMQWINEDLKPKKVLLVDEMDDTGSTLCFCLDKLKRDNNVTDIGVFVIHNKKKPKRYTELSIPYFCCYEVSDKWVSYPWDMA